MAWNPSPEVAAARDAAKALKANRVIVFFTRDDDRFGYASYGSTKAECAEAKKIADAVWETVSQEIMDQLY